MTASRPAQYELLIVCAAEVRKNKPRFQKIGQLKIGQLAAIADFYSILKHRNVASLSMVSRGIGPFAILIMVMPSNRLLML